MTTKAELEKLLNARTPFFLYQEIVKNPTDFAVQLRLAKQAIILVRVGKRFGHWCCVKLLPHLGEICYFSSFGTIPDEDKEKFIGHRINKRFNQKVNMLSKILVQYFARNLGYIVRYNQHCYQDPNDPFDQSCGLWCVKFLNCDGNEEDFFNSLQAK